MDCDFPDVKAFTIPESLLKDNTLPDPMELNYWEARKNRTFYIDFEVDDDYQLLEIAKTIINMNVAEKDTPIDELKPIYLWIMSYGGDLEQTNFFCDLVETSRIPIVTVAMGAAMSAAFLIFLAGKRRYAFKHSQLLIHSGSGQLTGTAEQIKEAQLNYNRQVENMKDYILARTTIDSKTFNKNKTKDWYLKADELVKYHIVDKLVENFDDIQ